MDPDQIATGLAVLIRLYLGDELDEGQRTAFMAILPIIERVLVLHPEHPHLARLASGLFRKVRQLDEAVELARRSYELSPDPDTAVYLGYAYREQGDFGSARSAFEAALELAPERLDIQSDFGWLLWLMGQPDEAIRRLQAVVDIDPDHAWAFPNLCYFHCLHEQDERWFHRLKRYFAAHPQNDLAAHWLQELY